MTDVGMSRVHGVVEVVSMAGTTRFFSLFVPRGVDLRG